MEKIESKMEQDDQGNEKKNMKFWKYLPYDKRNLQLSGEPPYDFSIDVYSLKCGEGLHYKKGTINYADDTLYEGELKNGRPHGFGKLVQRVP